jgi:hypothetical protein
LFEGDEGLLVVAGAEGAVADVLDELRGEIDPGAGDVGATPAEVLAVEPDGWVGSRGQGAGCRGL